MFFTSWELWEQMTFVLGCAIVAVFLMGYVKLLWMNRYVRKQELVDEAKRSRIEELRNSGQIIESQKGHDIPFGVRAIQSGIEVDGIWISKPNTPVPSEFRLDMSPTSRDRGSSGDAPQKKEKQNATRGRSPRRNDYANSNPVLDGSRYDQADLGSAMSSYKPRKSSHLRYDSYGETNDDDGNLAHLEGNRSPTKKKVHSHRPRGSLGTDLEDSSVADNEHSSGGSSDSDNTLSGNMRNSGNRRSRHSLIWGSQGDTGPVIAMAPSGRPTRESFPFQPAESRYAQVPLGDSPNYEGSNPFSDAEASRARSYPAHPLGGQTLGNEEYYVDYRPVQHSGSHTPPVFVPGELHVNKQVRKVNSGFEVLPAGTFGAQAKVRSHDAPGPSEEDSADRRQARLQKKPRTSLTNELDRS